MVCNENVFNTSSQVFLILILIWMNVVTLREYFNHLKTVSKPLTLAEVNR